jgi:hypothetical protein
VITTQKAMLLIVTAVIISYETFLQFLIRIMKMGLKCGGSHEPDKTNPLKCEGSEGSEYDDHSILGSGATLLSLRSLSRAYASMFRQENNFSP